MLDPSIPLSGRPIPQVDLGLMEQQVAQVQEARARAQERVQKAKDEAAAKKAAQQINDLLRSALKQNAEGVWTYDRNMIQPVLGVLPPDVAKMLDESDTYAKKVHESHAAALLDAAKRVDMLGNDPGLFENELDRLVKNGVIPESEAAPFREAIKKDPTKVALLTGKILGKPEPKPGEGDFTLGGGRFRQGESTPYAVAPPEPEKPPTAPTSVQEYEYYAAEQRKAGKTPLSYDAYQTMDANRRRSVTTINTGGAAEVQPIDATSQNILSQTGLNMNAFYWLTGQGTKLSRDAATRTKAARDAEAWARAHNVDISTLASQYQAYNTVLSANISRLNNTKIMESELEGTIDNLQGVAKASDLSKLRIANVFKVWAGQEVNDDLAQQYALHLGQLRNELTAYYAATQGRSGNNITMQDQRDAEAVIRNGVAQGSLDGLRSAVQNSTKKMGTVMQGSVDRARKEVWSLFGVGQNYKDKSETASAVSAAVQDALKSKGPGEYDLSDGHTYRKDAAGKITVVK